jgi:hypothetical protein
LSEDTSIASQNRSIQSSGKFSDIADTKPIQ